MINTILQGFLWFVSKVFSVVLSPFISGLILMFPSLRDVFTYITNFFTLATRYMVTACQLLLIPKEAILLFFSTLIIFGTIRVSILSINFFTRVYNRFKP